MRSTPAGADCETQTASNFYRRLAWPRFPQFGCDAARYFGRLARKRRGTFEVAGSGQACAVGYVERVEGPRVARVVQKICPQAYGPPASAQGAGGVGPFEQTSSRR